MKKKTIIFLNKNILTKNKYKIHRKIFKIIYNSQMLIFYRIIFKFLSVVVQNAKSILTTLKINFIIKLFLAIISIVLNVDFHLKNMKI